MPKMKTKSSAKKRFRVRPGGTVKRGQAFKRHILTKKTTKNTSTKKKTPLSKIDPKIIQLFSTSIDDLEDENGWAFLGDLGNLILKKKTDFDPRNYGFSKLLPLIKSMQKFEIDVRETNNPNVKHIYIRKK